MSEARARLRDMIAENEGARRNGLASDGRGWYRTKAELDECFAIADAVMQLFAYVAADAEWLAPGYAVVWLTDPTTKEN